MRVLLIILSLILMMPSLFAFDGKRKGFVIGGGLGYSPYVSISASSMSVKEKYSSESLAFNTHIGYAWDENNQVLLEDSHSRLEIKGLINENFYSYFLGPAWYHFFGKTGKSFFTTFGIGYYFFESSDNDNYEHQWKVAFLFGGGYEFTRHFQLNLKYVLGKTDYYGYDYNHTHLNFTITASLY